MKPIPMVWSNDDITVGQTVQLRRQLAMLDRLGIPGTFYVIPRNGDETIDQDAELLRAIKDAEQRGHEFYQHGYVHTPFESGVPELWMLEFSAEVKKQYDTERLQIEASHTLEAMVEKIARGAAIWRKAFGKDSPGYRPGWGAYCINLYRALKVLGFAWVSSRLPAPTSWMWNQLRWDYPIELRPEVPTRPYVIEGLMEYPVGGDFAFRVPNDPQCVDRMVELGVKEFELFYERQDPWNFVSHWHGLERAGDYQGCAKHPTGTGYLVHEKLLPRLKADPRGEFVRMSEVVRRYPGLEGAAVGRLRG